MMHGPCGHANRKSPCMEDGKCSRFFPKKWKCETVVDQDGYPIYRRRNDGKYIEKNRYVVPYNPNLLLRYQAHLNIEWCNQSTFIKYLFQYINKGYDRIIATLVPVQNNDGTTGQCFDDVKHYVDERYISSCEACWRIFSFQIHERSPTVKRLYFYLPSENSIIFEDDDDIEALLSKPIVKDSMFTSSSSNIIEFSLGK